MRHVREEAAEWYTEASSCSSVSLCVCDSHLWLICQRVPVLEATQNAISHNNIIIIIVN